MDQVTSSEKYKRILFCDFDGTVTTEETFVGMLKEFATERYDSMERLLADGKITLRDAVRRMVSSIPSQKYADVLDYVRTKPIRPGFEELLEFLHHRSVPFVIVSGGLLDSVRVRLNPFSHRIHAMHAARVNADGEHLRVWSDFESDDELVAKPKVMAKYPADESVVIGDGITDLNAAAVADLVFARDSLRRYLGQKGIPFVPWNDFFEVMDHLSRRWLAG